MEGMVVFVRPGAELEQDRPFEETAGRDRLVDPGQVLEDRLPGAQVQVADFGVAHLAVRQADEAFGGLQRAMRPALQEGSPVGHSGLHDGIDLGLVADAEAVEDDEDDRARAPGAGGRVAGGGTPGGRVAGRHACFPSAAARVLAVRAALATMPAISSGLGEAPPTSPPSIECSARNSPMLALVTLPPYRTGTLSAASPQPRSAARVARIASAIAAASAADAVRPVPMAQTGSYAITNPAAWSASSCVPPREPRSLVGSH